MRRWTPGAARFTWSATAAAKGNASSASTVGIHSGSSPSSDDDVDAASVGDAHPGNLLGGYSLRESLHGHERRPRAARMAQPVRTRRMRSGSSSCSWSPRVWSSLRLSSSGAGPDRGRPRRRPRRLWAAGPRIGSGRLGENDESEDPGSRRDWSFATCCRRGDAGAVVVELSSRHLSPLLPMPAQVERKLISLSRSSGRDRVAVGCGHDVVEAGRDLGTGVDDVLTDLVGLRPGARSSRLCPH